MTTTNIPKIKSKSIDLTIRPSTQAEMDHALGVLSTHKEEWATMDILGRIALLDQIKQDLPKVEKRGVTAGMAAKGAEYKTYAEGEELFTFAGVYWMIRTLRNSLEDILKYGKPKIPGKVFSRPDGQVVAQVVPADWRDTLLLQGIRAEVWMDPSISLGDGGIPQASFYHDQDSKGQICLILGAGNAGSLVPGDFLHKLFVEGQVVLLKMNPVNEYLGPIFEEGFRVLIEEGFLQILYGGIQEGSYLTNHSAVDNVHLTGSVRTYDAIVFGPGENGRQRKQARQAKFTKPFSAELGNISPVIVVPGPWSKKEVKNQSERLASWLMFNAGCYCNTPRMIIQMKDWEHRRRLNDGIIDFLRRMKTRTAYYPGSIENHKKFVGAHPNALQMGEPKSGHLPWTFIQDLDPANEEDICFTQEPFMSLYSETALEARDVVEYVGKAVEFANEKLWGTLVATILVHPESMKVPAVAAAVDQAIADLHYGSIVINNAGSLAYAMLLTPWGGYPGSDIYDVQSGIGFVNNPLMFDRPQKSVVFSEFSPIADPFLVNITNSYLFFRQDVRYRLNPSLINLLNLFWKAITFKKAKIPAVE